MAYLLCRATRYLKSISLKLLLNSFQSQSPIWCFEFTPSVPLTSSELTLTTNPSQVRFTNNSQINNLFFCHSFTCQGSAVRYAGGTSKNQDSNFLISSISE